MSKTGQPRLSPSRDAHASSTNANEDSAKTADQSKKDAKKGDKKSIEFQLPPLNIVGKKKEIDFEQIRKKVIRRGSPEGEDRKQLASILKHLNESKAKVRVQEFVSLVSKFTEDNGEVMRNVMEEDLASFRRLVTKVYENMTQDVSDVLVNEQIQTANFYQERYDMFNNKMLWMISEIFQMIPDFDFEKYAADKDDYLKYVYPIPALVRRDAEDINIQKRQEAFHRLQWLKIEEDRLAEENRRLEKRLEDLKKQHKREMTQANMKTKIMEERIHHLEDQEQERQEHLNELESLLGKNIVRTEAYLRLEEDETIRMTKPLPRVSASAKKVKRAMTKNEWSLMTATSMEESAAKKLFEAESAIADEKKRMRRRIREPGRETTLFGQSSMNAIDYPEFPSAAHLQEKTIQQTTSTVQEKRPPRRHQSKGSCRGGCR